MIRILITGDFCPCDRVAALIGAGEWEAVLGEVKALTGQMDYSVTNFETTVASPADRPIAKAGPCLCCTARAAEALRRAGFDMVTVTNNHFFDYGQAGVEQSLAAFRDAGLDHVGGGRDLAEAGQTLYRTIAGREFAFVNCCEHEFSIATGEHGGCNPLDPVRQYYAIREAKRRADHCIVIVHGGHEQIDLPSPRMKAAYRFFVDAGADAVVNHHQHCPSGYEVYVGKPIFYGLGNFCFDRAGGRCTLPGWHEGYAVELQFDGGGAVTPVLHPYEQCRREAAVRFLADTAAFEARIAALNRTIADDDALGRAIGQAYDRTARAYLAVFEPYGGRWLKAAWLRGWLPSFFRGAKRYRAMNLVACESHLDRLRHAISRQLE